MRGGSRSVALMAGAWLLSFWATAAGQTPAITKSESAAGALRLRTDRQAADRLQAARTQWRQGHIAEALQQLGQLPADAFVADGAHFVSGTWAAAQARRALTPQQRALYAAAAEQPALAAWQRYRASQAADDLLVVCRDFGDTRSGLTAWLTLAARERDQRHVALSSAAWEQVLRHPHATPRERTAAVLGQIEAALHAGETESARELWQNHQALLDATTVSVAGQQRLAGEIARGWLSDRPSTRIRPVPIARPALSPRWSVPLRPPRDLGPHLDQWLQELRDNGVWRLPAVSPLVTDHLVLVRAPQALLAIHRDAGELAWQAPLEDWPWIDSNPGILENAGFRMALLEQMGKRLLADSVSNRLVADDEHVYVVLESRQSQGSPLHFGAPARNADGIAISGERFNHLAAYRLDNGELAWKIGGAPAGPAYPLGGEFFSGPPTVVDDVLYVVGQQQTELQLLALDARRGELLWRTTLGDLPRALNADPARQRIACPVVWHRGVLLCPTAAGALVAVDPLTRSPRWAHRYGVAARSTLQSPRGENTAYLPDPWWSAWRDATVRCVDDIAVLVSPESDRLHAVRIETGQPLWSLPRDDGLVLIGTEDRSVFVAERTAVRAHELTTGRVLWRTTVDEIAGRAVVSAENIVVPTSNGGVQRLRCLDGQRWPGGGVTEHPLGNLVAHRGDWFAASTDAVSAWSDLAPARATADAAFRQFPEQADVVFDSARRALEAGDAELAWNRLATQVAPSARVLKGIALRTMLERVPARWGEFRELASTALDAAEVALVLSDAAARTGDPVAAADLLMAGVRDTSAPDRLVFENSRRQVRADLALSGALADLLRRSDVATQRLIAERMEAQWQRAATGTDPFAVQRLTERWAGLEFVREKLSTTGDAPFLGLPLLTVELRLHEAAGSRQPSVRRAAWMELIRWQTQNGFPREADDLRTGLLRGQFGPDGVAVGQRLAMATTVPDAPWPSVLPQVDSQRERNEEVYQFPVPLDAESSPFFDRLDVLVDRQGRSVRFSGGGVSGAWTVTLPTSQSAFRYLQHQTCGWGRGSLLILRVGFELFALAPFNDRGEPQAKVLWTLNTAGEFGVSHDKLRPDVWPAVPGVREDEYRIVDPYGRTVGQVGPVRAGYLCYAEKAKLVAVDTQVAIDAQTVRRRWERHDLPVDFVLGGDDDMVSIWQPTTGVITWVSALDGRTLRTTSCGWSPDQVILQAGRWFWHRDARRLVCEDAYAQSTVWSHPLQPRDVPFALPGLMVGVVRPGGELTVLNGLTGQPLGSPLLIDGPAEIDRVVVAKDAARWYVAVSERVSQQAGLQGAQLRSGFRMPFITGPLVAIDRDSGASVWQTHLEREPWSADQPRAAPLLMQVYKLPQADLQAGRHADGVVQLRDKRTGSIVFRKQHSELIGYATLTADSERSVVDLQLERETVRLRYRPQPPPPAMPER